MSLDGIRLLIRTAFRILFFRVSTEELRAMDRRHLVFGLLCTWIVGIGRWWEDPRAGLLQHLGLGSVLYVFILALFLWLVLWPMTPEYWSYVNLLTFISLTSLPGILYAIPVRHGLDLEFAQTVRLWLLAIVSFWRVALLAFYLGRAAGFTGFPRTIATVFPLGLIVFALTALNLEKVVFSFMGGLQPEDRSVNDSAYGVLMLISALSLYLIIPLFLCYAVLSGQALMAKRARRKLQAQDSKTLDSAAPR
jgi:hypothetical protein